MEETEEIGVDDTAWIIDKLGEDVLPEQDKRELTENSVQAVLRRLELDRQAPGEVLWDVDDLYFAATGVRKLCLTDNGDGFDEPGFRANIMKLAPRGTQHGTLERFGVGAKIAGVTRHPLGMIYQSWQQAGRGIFAHLWRDPDGRYGLRRRPVGDNKWATVVDIDDTYRPELVTPSGTKVTLLGRDEDEDTFAPPEGSEHGGKWLSRYLNTRYFQLPEQVRVRVREGEDYTPDNPSSGRFRTITGQRPWLDQMSVASGIFIGSDFRIWWWILDEKRPVKDSHYATGGFVASKFLHEMFDLRERRSAPSILQKFGVTFGFNRVVLIVEPGVIHDDPDLPVEPYATSVDLQRAHVKHNDAPLDFDRYAAEFRNDMPEELQRFIEEEAQGPDEGDRRKRYRASMEKLRELFLLPRYRPTPTGEELADLRTNGPGGSGNRGEGETTRPGPRARPDRGTHPAGTTGNVYPLRTTPDGIPARVTDELPDVDFTWVSDADDELPERGGEMEDRAARYVPETNQLLINADFRLFALMTDHWTEVYQGRPGVKRMATEAVRDVYTGVLVETVVGMLAFRGDQQWSETRLAEALSEEALTAAVMPRVSPHRQIGSILRGHYQGAA
jgi:hypothetical protein